MCNPISANAVDEIKEGVVAIKINNTNEKIIDIYISLYHDSNSLDFTIEEFNQISNGWAIRKRKKFNLLISTTNNTTIDSSLKVFLFTISKDQLSSEHQFILKKFMDESDNFNNKLFLKINFNNKDLTLNTRAGTAVTSNDDEDDPDKMYK